MQYPTILQRYLATFIDGIFVLGAFIAISYSLNFDNAVAQGLKLTLLFLLFFVYEPLCTSQFCTLGQKAMGIRIRRTSDYSKIGFFAAYLRLIVKGLLGFISFFAIIFSKQRRALHDFTVGSIVLKATPRIEKPNREDGISMHMLPASVAKNEGRQAGLWVKFSDKLQPETAQPILSGFPDYMHFVQKQTDEVKKNGVWVVTASLSAYDESETKLLEKIQKHTQNLGVPLFVCSGKNLPNGWQSY